MLTKDQEDFRKDKIGGSDAAAACGVSSYDSPLELYEIKKGLKKREVNVAMRRGRLLEPLIVDLYKEITKEEVNTDFDTFIHSEYHWMIANLDGITSSGKILECKSITFFDAKDWGPDGSNIIKEEYQYQLQHYCTVTGIKEAVLVALDAFGNVRMYNYKSNEETERKMIELEKVFYYCLTNDILPAPTKVQDFFNHPDKLKADEYIYIDEELKFNLQRIEDCKKSEKDLKEHEDRIKLMILKKMDKASAILDINGDKIVDVSKGRFNINYKRLGERV